MDLSFLSLFSWGVFLLSLMAVVWSCFYRVPRLEIDDRGILDRSLGLGRIRWDEIEGAYQGNAAWQDCVFLRLRPTDRVIRRFGRSPRGLPTAVDAPVDVRLDLADSGMTPFEVVLEVVARGRTRGSRQDC